MTKRRRAAASSWFKDQMRRLRQRRKQGPDSDETLDEFAERLFAEFEAILKREQWKNDNLLAGILANATDDGKGYHKPLGRPPKLGRPKRQKPGRPRELNRVQDHAWLADLQRRRADHQREHSKLRTHGNPFLLPESLGWEAAERARLGVRRLSARQKTALSRLLKRHRIPTARSSW